jgi:hypothetical protein
VGPGLIAVSVRCATKVNGRMRWGEPSRVSGAGVRLPPGKRSDGTERPEAFLSARQQRRLWRGTVITLVGVPASAALAALSYHYVEEPISAAQAPLRSTGGGSVDASQTSPRCESHMSQREAH